MSNDINKQVQLESNEFNLILINARELLAHLSAMYGIKFSYAKKFSIMDKLEIILERAITNRNIENDRKTFSVLSQLADTYINNQIKYTLLERSIVKK